MDAHNKSRYCSPLVLGLAIAACTYSGSVCLAQDENPSQALESRDIDSYFWLNDFVLADIDGDGLLDVTCTNHGIRPRTLMNKGSFNFEAPDPESVFTFRHVLPNLLPGLDTPDTSAPGLHVFHEGFWAKVIGQGYGDYFGKLVITGDSDDPYGNFAIVETQGDVLGAERGNIAGRKQITLELGGDFEFTIASTNKPRTLFASILIPHNIDLSSTYVGPRSLPIPLHEFHIARFQPVDWHNLVWFDFNDDNLLDLFAAQGGESGLATADSRSYNDLLLLSGTEPLMYDAAYETGIRKLGMPARGAMIADIDRNGLMDIYVRNHREKGGNKVFRNTLQMQYEPLKFEEKAESYGLDFKAHGIGKWIDTDNDGWVELLWADKSSIRLFKNNQGSFEEITLTTDLTYSSWITVGDFDNDADIDVVVACSPKPIVLRNNNGTLEPEPASTLGIKRHFNAAQLVDYNNDGYLDLYAPPMGMYLQDKDGSFTSTGYHSTEKHWDPLALGDLDNDGRVDIIRRSGFSREQTHEDHVCACGDEAKVFQANTYSLTLEPNQIRNDNHWYDITLVGPKHNRQAIGATVLLKHNGRSQLAMVGQFDSCQTSIGNYRIHFGLGQTPPAPEGTSLVVNWPDGQTTTLEAPASNTQLKILHPDRTQNPG